MNVITNTVFLCFMAFIILSFMGVDNDLKECLDTIFSTIRVIGLLSLILIGILYYQGGLTLDQLIIAFLNFIVIGGGVIRYNILRKRLIKIYESNNKDNEE